MRAAVLHAHGAVPEVGEYRDPEPGPAPTSLEVARRGDEPDRRPRSPPGTFPLERHEPPYVAGKEGVGRRADGSLVYFEYSREPFGAFAERTLVARGRRLPACPTGSTRRSRSAWASSGLAAWLGAGLARRGCAPGETVLVLGASGVVGQIARAGGQAARRRAASSPPRATRRPRARARLGADALVALDGGDDLPRRCARPRAAAATTSCSTRSWGAPAVAAIARDEAVRPASCNLGQSAGAEATLASAPVRATPVDLLGYTNYTRRRGAQGRGLRAAGRPRRRGRDPSRSSASARRRARRLAAPGRLAARASSSSCRSAAGLARRRRALARRHQRAPEPRRSADAPARGTSRTRAGTGRSRPTTASSAVSTRGGSAGISRCSRSAIANAGAWAAENAP